MPFKDPTIRKERQAEYSRAHYARNRERIIAETAARKRSEYAGTCVNCGGPTVGRSKGDAPRYCGKPECASAQRRNR